MGRDVAVGLPELRDRVQAWRSSREKLGPMPLALWEDAVALAKHLGINPVSSSLGLSYTRLRKRLEKEASGTSASSIPEFVELEGEQLLFRPTSGQGEKKPLSEVVIEVSPGDGRRLTIRLGAGRGLDVAALVRAFRD